MGCGASSGPTPIHVRHISDLPYDVRIGVLHKDELKIGVTDALAMADIKLKHKAPHEWLSGTRPEFNMYVDARRDVIKIDYETLSQSEIVRVEKGLGVSINYLAGSFHSTRMLLEKCAQLPLPRDQKLAYEAKQVLPRVSSLVKSPRKLSRNDLIDVKEVFQTLTTLKASALKHEAREVATFFGDILYEFNHGNFDTSSLDRLVVARAQTALAWILGWDSAQHYLLTESDLMLALATLKNNCSGGFTKTCAEYSAEQFISFIKSEVSIYQTRRPMRTTMEGTKFPDIAPSRAVGKPWQSGHYPSETRFNFGYYVPVSFVDRLTLRNIFSNGTADVASSSGLSFEGVIVSAYVPEGGVLREVRSASRRGGSCDMLGAKAVIADQSGVTAVNNLVFSNGQFAYEVHIIEGTDELKTLLSRGLTPVTELTEVQGSLPDVVKPLDFSPAPPPLPPNNKSVVSFLISCMRGQVPKNDVKSALVAGGFSPEITSKDYSENGRGERAWRVYDPTSEFFYEWEFEDGSLVDVPYSLAMESEIDNIVSYRWRGLDVSKRRSPAFISQLSNCGIGGKSWVDCVAHNGDPTLTNEVLTHMRSVYEANPKKVKPLYFESYVRGETTMTEMIEDATRVWTFQEQLPSEPGVYGSSHDAYTRLRTVEATMVHTIIVGADSNAGRSKAAKMCWDRLAENINQFRTGFWSPQCFSNLVEIQYWIARVAYASSEKINPDNYLSAFRSKKSLNDAMRELASANDDIASTTGDMSTDLLSGIGKTKKSREACVLAALGSVCCANPSDVKAASLHAVGIDHEDLGDNIRDAVSKMIRKSPESAALPINFPTSGLCNPLGELRKDSKIRIIEEIEPGLLRLKSAKGNITTTANVLKEFQMVDLSGSPGLNYCVPKAAQPGELTVVGVSGVFRENNKLATRNMTVTDNRTIYLLQFQLGVPKEFLDDCSESSAKAHGLVYGQQIGEKRRSRRGHFKLRNKLSWADDPSSWYRTPARANEMEPRSERRRRKTRNPRRAPTLLLPGRDLKKIDTCVRRIADGVSGLTGKRSTAKKARK